MSQKKDHGFITFFLPFVAIGFVLTLIAFLFLAVVYRFVPLSSAVLKVITAVISVCVLLIISYLSAKEAASVITGGITALIYSVIHSIFAVLSGSVPLLSVRTPFIIATGFLIGLIGAIFGDGSVRGRRRRYR